MIVGFNHNITYRGVCFHVQTEDSGIKTPHLITLLYHGGTIICSQKTSYADILNVDNLESVIEDLAKEQHKGMLRRLKKGEFDQRIIDYGIGIKGPAEKSPAETVEADAAPPAAEAVTEGADAAPDLAAELEPEVEFPEPDAVATADEISDVHERTETGSDSTDLDDLIFSYLSGDDENN